MHAPPAPSMRNPAMLAEIERRVGRNVLVFQAIEQAFKALLSCAVIDVVPNDAEDRNAARAARVSKFTMGMVAKGLFDEVLTSDPIPLPDPDPDPQSLWMRTRTAIAAAPAVMQRWRAEVQQVIDDRNYLVHHFRSRWIGKNDDADSQAALHELDAQHERATRLHQEFIEILNDHDAARRSVAACYTSERGQTELEFALLQARLVGLLADAAQTRAQPDGWTVLATAGDYLQSAAPRDAGIYRECYGKRWLRSLLDHGADVFEVRPESDAAKGRQPRYRLREPTPT